VDKPIIKKIAYNPKKIIAYIERVGTATAQDLEKEFKYTKGDIFTIISDLVDTNLIIGKYTETPSVPVGPRRFTTRYQATDFGRKIAPKLEPKVIELVDITKTYEGQKIISHLFSHGNPFDARLLKNEKDIDTKDYKN
jgi:hypothetical protein